MKALQPSDRVKWEHPSKPPDHDPTSKMDKAFKAINDPTRREILRLLKEKDLTAGEIADHFDMSKPSISHHLDLLKQADLVTTERNGQFILYSINTTVVDEILNWLLSLKGK